MKYVILAILLVLAGCVSTPEVKGNDTVPVITPVNGTNVTDVMNTTPPLINSGLPDILELGDIARVNYILWVNGTVQDTNIEEVARENGIYTITRTYEPMEYEASFDSGLIKGFIINTLGMELNETVKFQVDPARGYGPYDPTNKFSILRYYNRSFFEVVPRADIEDLFAEQNITIEEGTAFKQPSGDVVIQNVTNDTITLFYVLVPGTEFMLYNALPQKVVSTNETTAVIENNYLLGDYYYVPHPQTSQMTLCKVSDKTNESITFDCNHRLANETLTFQVTLVDLFKKG